MATVTAYATSVAENSGTWTNPTNAVGNNTGTLATRSTTTVSTYYTIKLKMDHSVLNTIPANATITSINIGFTYSSASSTANQFVVMDAAVGTSDGDKLVQQWFDANNGLSTTSADLVYSPTSGISVANLKSNNFHVWASAYRNGGSARTHNLSRAWVTVTYTVEATVNAAVMTASGEMVDPGVVPGTGNAIEVEAMTASSEMVDPQVDTNSLIWVTRPVSVLADATVSTDVNISNPGTYPLLLAMYQFDQYRPYMAFDTGAINNIESAKIIGRRYGSQYESAVVEVHKVTQTWSENSITWNNQPTSSYVGDASWVVNGDWVEITLPSSLTASELQVGIMLYVSGAGVTFWSKEATDPAHIPTLEVVYTAVPSPNEVEADVMVGDGMMPHFDPSVVVEVAPATGSGEMPDPLVGLSIDAEPEPMTADGEMPDAEATSDLNAIVTPLPLIGSARMPDPVEAINPMSDPYYARIWSLTDNDDMWLRLDETSGTVVYEQINTTSVSGPPYARGTYIGGPTLGLEALEGRNAVWFDGINDRIDLPHVINAQLTAANATTEIVFRTTKQNQDLFGGAFTTTHAGGKGKVGIKNGRMYVGGFTGRLNVADGNWHHVAIAYSPNDSGRLEIFVDGQLDIRRILAYYPSERYPDLEYSYGVWRPNWIGGTNGQYGHALTPSNLWFQGEIMEFVHYVSRTWGVNEMQGNYYAAFGHSPIRVAPFSGDGAMPTHEGKGNRKRILNLVAYAPGFGRGVFNWDSQSVDFGPVFLPHNPEAVKGTYAFQSLGYDFTVHSVPMQDPSYRDEVTDEARFIDLQKDINIKNYDIICVRFWPNQGHEFDHFRPWEFVGHESKPDELRRKREAFIESLRWAVDQGVSLLVTEPQLATDLGIITSAQAHTQAYNDGETVRTTASFANGVGMGSQRSASIAPIRVISNGTPFTKEGPETVNPGAGLGWFDNDRINKYRVTGLVDGLTDLEGHIVTDKVVFWPEDNFRISRPAWKYEDRTNGLQLGDEFLIDGLATDYRDYEISPVTPYGRSTEFVWSVPANAVAAGTVVTRMNQTYWAGSTLKSNPFANNATTIVLQPGDPLKGRPVGGKIFVNFTEAAMLWGPFFMPIQIVPPNNQITNPNDHESDYVRSWDYSSWRWNVNYSQVSSGAGMGSIVILENVGGDQLIYGNTRLENRLLNAGAGGYMVTVATSEKYEVDYVPTWTMVARGVRWLSDRTSIAEGDVVIRPAAMTATATMPKPTIYTERDVIAGAQSMVAIGVMPDPEEVVNPDAKILVLPMTGFGEIIPHTKQIFAEPMEGFGEMIEIFDQIFTSGEDVVLFVHDVVAVLYIEEGV